MVGIGLTMYLVLDPAEVIIMLTVIVALLKDGAIVQLNPVFVTVDGTNIIVPVVILETQMNVVVAM